jgi:hypothetical protein
VTKAIRVLFASLLFGTALIAGAQTVVQVQVPFDFHVSGRTLPAGSYTLTRVFDREPSVLRISGAEGQESVVFLTGLESSQTGAGLSFHRYGDSYYLSAIATASGKFSLPRTRAERLAASKSCGGEVTVGSE